MNIYNHFPLPIDLPCIKALTDHFCYEGVSLFLSLFGTNPQMNGFHHETAIFLRRSFGAVLACLVWDGVWIRGSLVAQTVKNSPAMHGTQVQSVPGSPEEGITNRLQYSCLENPMVRGDWQAPVHGVTKSQTRLSSWARTDGLFCTLLGTCIFTCFGGIRVKLLDHRMHECYALEETARWFSKAVSHLTPVAAVWESSCLSSTLWWRCFC